MTSGTLADPDFEPSDRALGELALGAFARARASHELELERVHRDVERARERATRELDERGAR